LCGIDEFVEKLKQESDAHLDEEYEKKYGYVGSCTAENNEICSYESLEPPGLSTTPDMSTTPTSEPVGMKNPQGPDAPLDTDEDPPIEPEPHDCEPIFYESKHCKTCGEHVDADEEDHFVDVVNPGNLADHCNLDQAHKNYAVEMLYSHPVYCTVEGKFYWYTVNDLAVAPPATPELPDPDQYDAGQVQQDSILSDSKGELHRDYLNEVVPEDFQSHKLMKQKTRKNKLSPPRKKMIARKKMSSRKNMSSRKKSNKSQRKGLKGSDYRYSHVQLVGENKIKLNPGEVQRDEECEDGDPNCSQIKPPCDDGDPNCSPVDPTCEDDADPNCSPVKPPCEDDADPNCSPVKPPCEDDADPYCSPVKPPCEDDDCDNNCEDEDGCPETTTKEMLPPKYGKCKCGYRNERDYKWKIPLEPDVNNICRGPIGFPCATLYLGESQAGHQGMDESCLSRICDRTTDMCISTRTADKKDSKSTSSATRIIMSQLGTLLYYSGVPWLVFSTCSSI